MSGNDSFKIERRGDLLIVVPSSEIESLDWQLMDEVAEIVLEPIKREEAPAVAVDLSGVSYFGSAFLSLLLACWKNVAERGGTMVLAGPSERARELLHITGLDTLWAIYSSRDEAIEALLAE